MRKLTFILLFVFAMSICGCSESYAGGRQEAAPSAASSRIPEEKPLTEGPTYYFDVEEVYKMYRGLIPVNPEVFPFFARQDIDDSTIITMVVTNEELDGEILERLVQYYMYGIKFRLDLSRIKRFTNSAWGSPVTGNTFARANAMIRSNDYLTEVVLSGKCDVRFHNCNGLKKVSYVGSENVLADGGFSECANLSTVVFAKNSTISGGSYTFYNCSSLTSIKLPPVTEGCNLYGGLFAGCKNLVSVELPPNLQVVAKDVFTDCVSLESLVFPETVICIEDSVRGCTSLKSITFGKNLEQCRISFVDCTSLSKVTVKQSPALVMRNGLLMNQYCTSLYLVTDKAVKKGTFAVPDSVEYIVPGAFSPCHTVSRVTNVPDLEDGSEFSGCSSLESVAFRDTAERIGERSFARCTALKQFTVPENINAIGMCAFQGCTALESVVLHDNIPRWGINAGIFRDCTALKTVVLPSTLKTLPNDFFRGSGLESLECGTNLTGMLDNTFRECLSLKEVVVPENIARLGTATFYGCANLTKITLPSAIESIGGSDFAGCTSLTDIVIPDTVTVIKNDAFRDCVSLPELVLPEGLTRIGDKAFMNCSSLKSLIIPPSVTGIGKEFISGCSGLTEITIPDSVVDFNLEDGLKGTEHLSVIRFTGTKAQFLDRFNCYEYRGPQILCSDGEVTSEELYDAFEEYMRYHHAAG